MNETVVINAYIVISIIIAATDILLAVKSFKMNKTTGRFLGFACMGAAIVDISYLISIRMQRQISRIFIHCTGTPSHTDSFQR